MKLNLISICILSVLIMYNSSVIVKIYKNWFKEEVKQKNWAFIYIFRFSMLSPWKSLSSI